MKLRTQSPKSLIAAASALMSIGLLAACSTGTTEAAQSSAPTTVEASATTQTSTPSQILSSTAWETTGATDASGNAAALTNENVSSFVGNAYFKADGTFTMFTLDDAPKMQGDWTLTPDGKTRQIVARDDAGKELFSRDSEIVTLNAEEFTYRVFPEAAQQDVYFDIIHTPTTHAEPAK